MNKWIYALCAFLGGVSFGVPSTFVKVAYGKGFSTADVIGSQFLFGAVFLWLVVLFSKRVKTPYTMILKLLLSGTPMALTGIFYYNSLNYLDASIAIIMLFQFTWMGLIGEWLIDKQLPTKEKVASVILLFIGSLFAVNIVGSSLSSLPIQGILWGILAAACFATFILLSGKVGINVPPIKKSMLMATGGTIVALILYPPLFLFDGSIGNGLGLLGLVLALFGVVLPPLLFSVSMPKVGSGLGTILTASELPTAVIMSIIILKEHVTWTQWLGVCIVLVGIILPNLSLLFYQKRLNRYNN